MTLKEFVKKKKLILDDLLAFINESNYGAVSLEEPIDEELFELIAEEYKQTNETIRKKKKKQSEEKETKKIEHEEQSIEEKKEPGVPREKPIIKTIANTPTKIAPLAHKLGISSSSIISYFLHKEKKLYSIHTLLSKEEMAQIAKQVGVTLIEAATEGDEVTTPQSFMQQEKGTSTKTAGKTSTVTLQERPPVVTIVGHVDHGKTTLLDTIQKKNRAATEKGGITQEIGAYTVMHQGKKITFIDTPGHAAFVTLRGRGISIADITILVVAFDDGVMEQTIESINLAKTTKSMLIVAITKMDRHTDKTPKEEACKKIFEALTKYDVLVEPWGGEVPVVYLSAKKNEGITNLLDVIVIASALLSLSYDPKAKGIGNILEVKMNRGLGVTATGILREGGIKTGDYFISGKSIGKAVALFDQNGKKQKEFFPGEPFVFFGFDSTPFPGDALFVSTQEEGQAFKKTVLHEEKKEAALSQQLPSHETRERISLIVKGDVFSSLEAIRKSIIDLAAQKHFSKIPFLVSAGVGEVTKNDIAFAATTKSIIYTFNTNTGKEMTSIAEKQGIIIKPFDVIYHLIEDITAMITEEKKEEAEKEVVGEGLVIKLFSIKNVGTVVGFRVISGKIALGNDITIMSNNASLGNGRITTLQQEKMSVKELAKGTEGAAIIQGFNDWQEGVSLLVYEKKK